MHRTLMPRSIGTRLLLALFGMSAITGVLGAWGIVQIGNLGPINAEIYDRPLMAINFARAAGTIFEQLDNDSAWAMIPSWPAAHQDDPRRSLFADLDTAEERASSPEAVAGIRDIRRLMTEWLSRREVSPTDTGLAPLAVRIRDAIEQSIEQMAQDGFIDRERAIDEAELTWRLSIAITAGAVGLSLLLALVFSRQIVRPLRAAAAVADQIAAGVFETPIPTGADDEAGSLLASLSVMQNRIRTMMEVEKSRRRSAQGRLVEALESSTEAMLLLDAKNMVVVANSRVGEFLAPLGARIKERVPFACAFPPDRSHWVARLSTPGEVLLPNGRWLDISREETSEGGVFLILSEITLRKSYERKLEAAAYEDPLTGIGNRAFLLDRMDREIATGGPLPESAVLVVNIDRFRQINNAHGQRIGDIVLTAIAERLSALAFENDICARTGGDEFVVWFRDLSAGRRGGLIEAAHSAFAPPVAFGDQTITPRVSGGLAWSGLQIVAGHDLLRDARAALDRAKATGGNHLESFDDGMRTESRIRLQIEQDLELAIEDCDIRLDYQPLIDLGTGRLRGFEALARWRHAELGPIDPMRFIPIAEETGAIVALGEFVLHEATEEAKRWAHDRMPGDELTVSVNISPRQITDPRNARRLLDYFDQHEAAARRVKLEITEGVLLEDPAAMLELLTEFKRRGVTLSLDDFGTGYSSLSYLHKFPFDELKIDRSFVSGIANSTEKRRLVRTIIELGRDLGLHVVAEGVETAEQAAHLKAQGCDLGQGYFFSAPVDAAHATAMLRRTRIWM
ncbi:MAG: EAL domain-containing protein [Aliidongia sp.]